MHAYDAKDLKRLFGLPVASVRSLTRAGHVTPVRRGGKLHYSFQDLIVLRTASALRAGNISARRITSTLQRLRATLPEGATLNKLSLTALNNRIAIREGRMLWESDTGQYALALDIDTGQGGLHILNPVRDEPVAGRSAEELFAEAYDTEETQPRAAEAAYRSCLQQEPNHREARINLGRLLHLAGRFDEAEKVYRAGSGKEPVIAFNLGVLLEDMDRPAEAMVSYREALAMDPQLADAHFNLARLYQLSQDPKASLRHLLAYRRMVDRPGN
jgi:tetratricopeptide (TPR) repeat protein